MKRLLSVSPVLIIAMILALPLKAETPYLSLHGTGKLEVPPQGGRPAALLEVAAERDEKGKPKANSFLLSFSYPGKRVTTITHPFRSGGGAFKLFLLDLTADGVREFLLVTGEGEEEAARAETLTVLRIDGSSLTEIFSKAISGGTDTTSWKYRLFFLPGEAGEGAILCLSLGKRGSCTSGEDPDPAQPSANAHYYQYDPRTDEMVQRGDPGEEIVRSGHGGH